MWTLVVVDVSPAWTCYNDSMQHIGKSAFLWHRQIKIMMLQSKGILTFRSHSISPIKNIRE
jgi:hypothetical protein